MPFRVVLDACVLIPYQLSDLLLRLAEAEMFLPLWSDKIMAEVNQNLPLKLGVTPHRAQRRIDHMTTAFPLAAVGGHTDLIPAMTNDPRDRHVLAAAVRGNADLIVTANLKDFLGVLPLARGHCPGLRVGPDRGRHCGLRSRPHRCR